MPRLSFTRSCSLTQQAHSMTSVVCSPLCRPTVRQAGQMTRWCGRRGSPPDGMKLVLLRWPVLLSSDHLLTMYYFLGLINGSKTKIATPIIRPSAAIDNNFELKSTPTESSRNTPATTHLISGIVSQPETKRLSNSGQFLFLFRLDFAICLGNSQHCQQHIFLFTLITFNVLDFT